MQEERNALAENVYPRLRVYCRDQYGIDFQVTNRSKTMVSTH